MKLIKAMATVAGLTGLSRIFGFLRDVLTAATLGAGPIADAFFVALKLPNLFRRVTAEGAFSVSFVPLYSEKVAKEGEDAAAKFSGEAFAVMLSILLPFTLLAIAAMPLLMIAIAPGFHTGEARYDYAVEMSRITFPYLLFMSLSSLVGGMLNAHDRFAPFAAAPIIFNLSMCLSLYLGTPYMGNGGYALSWGVFAAGILQFIWLYYCLRKAKLRLPIVRPRLTLDVKRLFKLMGPGVLGAGIVHINLFADIIMASFLPEGSISFLYYADRLNQLPLGMVGIAVGTALLPMLSKTLASGNHDEAKDLFNRAMEICLFLALPAAVALITIPDVLIKVLFERGEFGPEDTAMTAKVLMGYAIGLPAYIVIKVYSTGFWARQDTKTPVKIAIASTIMNIVLALTFSMVLGYGVAGIAFATGIVGWLQILFLGRALKAHPSAHMDSRFKRNAPKIIGASLLMGAVLLGSAHGLHPLLDGDTKERVFALLAIVASGSLVYAAAILGSGALKISDLTKYLKRKRN